MKNCSGNGGLLEGEAVYLMKEWVLSNIFLNGMQGKDWINFVWL